MSNVSINSAKNAARMERLQQRLDAGSVSTHYPQIESIVINMMYNQKGVQKALPRVVNFFPSSCALFKIDCLNKECVGGGFDLSQVITGMIRSRKETQKGELGCEGGGPSPSHSVIDYEVTIRYT